MRFLRRVAPPRSSAPSPSSSTTTTTTSSSRNTVTWWLRPAGVYESQSIPKPKNLHGWVFFPDMNSAEVGWQRHQKFNLTDFSFLLQHFLGICLCQIVSWSLARLFCLNVRNVAESIWIYLWPETYSIVLLCQLLRVQMLFHYSNKPCGI